MAGLIPAAPIDTKPQSASEIVANPAFTELLKSIGLDDIKMAERIRVSICKTVVTDAPHASTFKIATTVSLSVLNYIAHTLSRHLLWCLKGSYFAPIFIAGLGVT